MSSLGTVLVTGPTGNVGSGLVSSLLARKVTVRALVRDESKAQALRDQGANVVVGDLDKAETLAAAVDGVSHIYLLTWNGPTAVKQVKNLLNAAKGAGTPHVIRHSGHGSEKSRIIKQHIEAEAELKASGLPFTILRPTFFSQNTLFAAQTVASQGTIYMPLKDGKIAMIDVRDVVDCAAAALTSEGHEGLTYILTGPRAISIHDVAAILSDVLNKSVSYVDVPPDAGRQAMLGMGMPEWIVEGFVELNEDFAQNWADKASGDVEKLTGHRPRSYEDFARDFADFFRG